MPETDFADMRFEVQPDAVDERDHVYTGSGGSLPESVPPEVFKEHAGMVFSQGVEASCTGMALAGIANYLIRRHVDPEAGSVSPRMMYEMARRHDRLPDHLEGSNLRGALKGWNKHGVCSAELWPYAACVKHGRLTFSRVVDASTRVLAGYERIDRTNIEAMKAAIAEHGVLYANSILHENWAVPYDEGVEAIPAAEGEPTRGGHAFIIVGYDERGFWVQNSWGTDWGRDGCAILTYDDWKQNGINVWVAAIDPATIGRRVDSADADSPIAKAATFAEMWPHVVVVGDDGKLTTKGSFASAPEDLVARVEHFEDVTADWETRRLVLVAGAGVAPVYQAVAQAAAAYRKLLDRQIYPVFLLWQSDWLSPLVDMLERLADSDRYDRARASQTECFERPVSHSRAKEAWDEITWRAHAAASSEDGAARRLVDCLLESYGRHPFEFHLVSHGVGDALLSEIADRIGEDGRSTGATITSATLWAPATTLERFEETYLPLLKRGMLDHLSLFVLDVDHEKADSVGPYEHSVLYLACRALGTPLRNDMILGLEEVIEQNRKLWKLRKQGRLDVVVAPTEGKTHPLRTSRATAHGEFITDEATIAATVGRILSGSDAVNVEVESRDPLVRARAIHRAERHKREEGHRRKAIEECEDCQAIPATAGIP
jgi:hypothetical protein